MKSKIIINIEMTKIDSIVYSLFKKAIAPSCIRLAISERFEFSIFCLVILKAKNRAVRSARIPAIILTIMIFMFFLL